MEKFCIACGMPLKDKKDFAMGDESKNYCRYCANKDGTMMNYEEALEMAVKYCLEGDNYKTMNFATRPTESEARQGMIAYMSTLPAWANRKNA